MEWLPAPHIWLPELAQALAAVARAVKEQRPTPELLADLAPTFADAVRDHRVTFEWLANGYMYWPDLGDKPGPPEYAVYISGDRLKMAWRIPADDLPRVLAAASARAYETDPGIAWLEALTKTDKLM